MPKRKLIPKVTHLAELHVKALADPRYRRLTILAAGNLGGPSSETDDYDGARRWLELNAQETTEEGVVGEVNFVRDLVEEEIS